MAKTISDEQIKLSIIIDGNPAQKALFDLEKSTRKLTEENKALGLQKKLLEKQNKQESEEYKNLTATIKQNNAEIKKNKAEISTLQKEIGITGLTMAQLTKRAYELKMALANTIPGSEDYIKFQSEIKTISTRLSELKGNAQSAKLSIGGIADGFNRYAALGASAVAGLTGVVLSVQKIIDINGKLSDAQADVMKTTGMNKKEVDELTKSFGLLETRTSRIDLLKIAEQGGRLGVPKAEIQDFIKTMNMAAVSLGDSFTGGVDEVAEKLGKIKFLFKETKEMGVEQAYNSIGSAINDLGANGTANEANIAEFTKRIGSLTDVLKPTVQETLALGTAFEESGIEAETSSRAYNIFMKQASTESSKFAQVMGISKKAVEEMINTNPMNFMLDFAKGMNGMNATEVAKTLDFLGVNADGANKVIGAMGNNFSRFHELIDLSNNSFAQGTSLINEYNIKNETLGATLEKISKKVSGWFSSETFIAWLGGAVAWFAKFIGATEDADGSVIAWKNTLLFTAKIIAIVTAALVTNTGWQQLVALWTNRNTEATILYNVAAKARAFADGVAMISSQAYAVVTMLLTGNVKGAIQAFRVMTTTMMTTPWGFIIGAVVAIGTAYLMFSKEVKDATTAQAMMADTTAKTGALVEKESQTFMTLLAVVKDTTASTEARTEALKKAKEIGGEYTKGLTLENIATAEGKKMIDLYIQSLERKMQLQVLEAKQKELLENINNKKNQKLSEEVSYLDELWTLTKNLGNASNATADAVVTASKRRKDALSDLQKQLDFTNAEMKAFLEKNPNLIKTIGTDTSKSRFHIPDGTDGTTGKKDPNSSKEDIAKLRFEDEAKYAALSLKLKRQLEDEAIAIMQDGYEKEIAIENLRYKRKIEDLEKEKVHEDEIVKIDAEMAKALIDGDKSKYNALDVIKARWEYRNKLINKQIDDLELIEKQNHNNKIHKLELKQFDTSLKEMTDSFEHEKLLRETSNNNELTAVGDNANERERLKKEHSKKEYEAQLKHLQDLAGLMTFELYSQSALGLLSPEEKKGIQEKIDFYLNAISKLKAAESGTSDNKKLSLGGSKDILGFSQKDWDIFFSNIETGADKWGTMTMAIQAAANIFSEIDKLQTAQENARLKSRESTANKEKTRLKKQLDSGYISQAQYNKKIEKIDKELEDRKFEAELKQAKRQKIMALANIAVNTAQAIMSIASTGGGTYFADFGVSAAMLTALVAFTAGVQTATVLATPLPVRGAEEGLYPEYVTRQQDGKQFKSTGTSPMKSGLFSKPRILVGEGPGDMPEMVIDKKAYSQISPATKNALIRELQGIKGFEQGLYNEKLKRFETPAASSGSSTIGSSDKDNQMMQIMMALISENTSVMRDIRDNGILAMVSNRDLKSMKNLKDGITDYEALRNKSKK